jgi:hypothetical protein
VKDSSNTLGLDNIVYGIKWHPLDKDGKRTQVIEKTGNKGEEIKSSAGVGNPSEKEFEPPWDNKHGWEVELWIPPQQATNANSAGHDLDVFLPKGKKQLR